MDTSQSPITPVKQAMVEIAGHSILAALLPDGRIAAAFRMICGLLCLDNAGQQRRVLADPLIADSFIMATMQIGGQQRTVYLIVAEAIPHWLADIQINKVVPEARETLSEFQRVAVQTLRAFFFPETREQQAKSAPPKQEPESAPLPPPQEPPVSELDYFRLGIEGIGRKEAKQDARLDKHDQQIAMVIEEVDRIAEQVTDLAETGPLEWEHKIELRIRLQALEYQTGQPGFVLGRELVATFGVEVIEQLPEARWGQIVAWFKKRLGW